MSSRIKAFFKSLKGLYFNYIYDKKSENLYPRIYLFLILVIALYLAFFSYIRSTNFSYDESNTLNIASLSFFDISEALKNEHNFPFYYYILKIFSYSPHYILISKAFNYLIWILCVVSSYFFGKLVFKNKNSALTFTFLVAYSPLLNYYSFYIRMYGLMFLLLIFYQYFFIRILSREQNTKRNYFLFFVSSLLLSLIHPTSVFIYFSAAVAIFLLYVYKNQKNVFVLLTTFLSSIVILFLFLYKKGIYDTFMGGGSSYVFDFKPNILGGINSLLLIPPNAPFYSLVLFLFIYLVYRYFKKLNPGYLYIYSASSLIVYLVLVSYIGDKNPRHYIYFLLPLLFAIAKGIISLKKNVKMWLLPAVILFFVLNFINFAATSYNLHVENKEFCSKVSEFNNLSSLIVTNYAVYNPLRECLGKETLPKIYILGGDTLIYQADNKSFKENVFYQSRRGDSTDITDSRRFLYRSIKFKGNYPSSYIQEVKNILNQKSYGMEKLIYVTRYEYGNNNGQISTDEISLFSNFKFVRFISPSIYIFDVK